MDSASPLKTSVIGASGYAGEELVRLLLSHPHAQLASVTSRQYAGQSIAQVFPRFAHDDRARTLRFSEPDPDKLGEGADVVFLALPHGVAAEFAEPLIKRGTRVIDLSADFRLKDSAIYQEFYGHVHPAPGLLPKSVYGLPEWHKTDIASAQLVACPGCYPTSILLPLLPLLKAGLISSSGIIAHSLSGVTGAGRKVALEYLFSECNESVRPYGIPKHRHLSEIEQEIAWVAGVASVVQFTPVLVPVNRGILTTLYLTPANVPQGKSALDALIEQISRSYQECYGEECFVRLLARDQLPDTKNVVGTNFIDIAWRVNPRTNSLVVMSAMDNIVKGTSGQAIQCFNIMNGFPERTGLI